MTFICVEEQNKHLRLDQVMNSIAPRINSLGSSEKCSSMLMPAHSIHYHSLLCLRLVDTVHCSKCALEMQETLEFVQL